MLDGLNTYRGSNVCLARAGATDQNDVVCVVQEVAAMKLLHERLVDLAAGEVEAIQITIGREACRLELVGSRANFTFRGLCFQKLRQDRNGSLECRRSLLG